MFPLYRAPSAPDPTSPYVVYPTSMFSLHRGYGLWYPEPHEAGEPQIGDVGYVLEGRFIRLFNINTSKPEYRVRYWPVEFGVQEPPSPGIFSRLDRREKPIIPALYPSRGVIKRDVGGSIS